MTFTVPTLSAPLWTLQEVHGIHVDALVQDDRGALLFGSFWGRDTALQELLARLSLAPSEGGLSTLHIRDPARPEADGGLHRPRIDSPDTLAKLTGRLPAANLFGEIGHLWLHASLATTPDYANRRALRLFRAEPEAAGPELRDTLRRQDAVWALLKEVSPLPLLDDWREPVLDTALAEAWVTAHTGFGVHAVLIQLPVDGFEDTLGRLIREGRLRLPPGTEPARGDGGGEPPSGNGAPRDREPPPKRRLTTDELADALGQFTGTETWFRHALVRSMLYTEGVRFFAEEGGEQGAYWFLDVVATECFPLLPKEPFLYLVLSVRNQRATLRVEDGNDRVLRGKRIDYTDLQPGDWRFYLTDNVLLLPSEY
jgi:hypothetical protein